jgi:hypothetical protein
MDLWIMIGIVVFVVIGQAVLWSWVLIERQRKVPDVKIFNWKELTAEAQKIAENYYKTVGRR